MSPTWSKALMLPAADQRLLFESLTLILGFRVGLRVLSFDALRRLSNRWAACRKGDGNLFRTESAKKVPVPFSTARIVWAVAAVGARVPGTRCLVEALAAEIMLRRHGHAATLKLGVRLDALKLDAHAWVECDGVAVIGASSRLEEYAVLS